MYYFGTSSHYEEKNVQDEVQAQPKFIESAAKCFFERRIAI